MVIFGLFVSCTALNAKTYEEWRAKYKHDLFESQAGVLTEAEYSDFLEPYLQEAERKLNVPEYCRAHPDSDLVKEYFDCLLRYNFACFKKYIGTKDAYKARMKIAYDKLLDVMARMKTEWNLDDFDPVHDCAKVTKIIKKANEVFYGKLSIKNKAFCFFAKVGSLFK